MGIHSERRAHSKVLFWLLHGALLLTATCASAASPGQDQVNYYIDASGSMCGYLSANDPSGTFKKLVTIAMQSKDSKRGRRVYLLGSEGKKPTLAEAPDDLAAKVAQQSGGTTKGACASFVASESSLDGVFAHAKRAPGTSMIIVTDLLLKEGELTNFVDNIRDWALAPGNEGAHVGFITLRTPFDGPYYQVSGGKASLGRHVRPLTVVWFAASNTGRDEVRRVLAAVGISADNSKAVADVGANRCKLDSRPSVPRQAGASSSPTAASQAKTSAPGNDPATKTDGLLMFGLQLLPQLTSNSAQWLTVQPERTPDKWLDLQCRMAPGSGRNPISVDECATVKWLDNAIQITVRERCNDKELFPFKQTSALVALKPRSATGFTLEGISVSPSGPTRCASANTKGGISACNESDRRSDVIQLYRLPLAEKGNEPSQKVDLQLRMIDTDNATLATQAESLDLASDVCAPSSSPSDCRSRLEGKVYRYATFVAQASGRAKAVIQQRMNDWPRSFPVQVKVVPAAK